MTFTIYTIEKMSVVITQLKNVGGYNIKDHFFLKLFMK